jgi:hypothetical protein
MIFTFVLFICLLICSDLSIPKRKVLEGKGKGIAQLSSRTVVRKTNMHPSSLEYIAPRNPLQEGSLSKDFPSNECLCTSSGIPQNAEKIADNIGYYDSIFLPANYYTP